MRLVVPRGPLKQVLRWTQRALFACGIALLAYCAFVVTDAWIFQRAERRRLEQLRIATHDAKRAEPERISIAPPKPVVIDGLIGRIEIPRLGLSAMVMEGDNRTTLRRAVGHIPGTGLPGVPGNIGIAGHRDTFFRPLRNVHENDFITLTTPLGEYRYRVVSIIIVSPSDIAVLDPSVKEVLTLVTCYPFYFVGSAPERFIVRAERVT